MACFHFPTHFPYHGKGTRGTGLASSDAISGEGNKKFKNFSVLNAAWKGAIMLLVDMKALGEGPVKGAKCFICFSSHPVLQIAATLLGSAPPPLLLITEKLSLS